DGNQGCTKPFTTESTEFHRERHGGNIPKDRLLRTPIRICFAHSPGAGSRMGNAAEDTSVRLQCCDDISRFFARSPRCQPLLNSAFSVVKILILPFESGELSKIQS